VKRLISLALLLALATPCLAQAPARPPRRTEPPKTEKPAAPARPEAAPAPALPYDDDLMRLAEVMGSLAYLRDVCGFRDGAAWRTRMSDLLEAEAPTADRRDRLAGAFNRGFEGYSTLHRECRATTRLAIERLLDEGARLTRTITNRYGT